MMPTQVKWVGHLKDFSGIIVGERELTYAELILWIGALEKALEDNKTEIETLRTTHNGNVALSYVENL